MSTTHWEKTFTASKYTKRDSAIVEKQFPHKDFTIALHWLKVSSLYHHWLRSCELYRREVGMKDNFVYFLIQHSNCFFIIKSILKILYTSFFHEQITYKKKVKCVLSYYIGLNRSTIWLGFAFQTIFIVYLIREHWQSFIFSKARQVPQNKSSLFLF